MRTQPNSFGPTAAQGKVAPFSPPNAASMTCFFAKNDTQVQVTCTIAMTNPQSTVTVQSDLFVVEAPDIFHVTQSMGVGMVGVRDQNKSSPTYNQVTADATNTNFFGLYGATYPNRKTWGIFYDVWVQDKPGYLSPGQFAFCQLVTEDTTTTAPGGTPHRVFPQGIGVDYAYPYLNLPYKPATAHQGSSSLNWVLFGDRPYVGANGKTLQQEYVEIDRKASFQLYVFYLGGDDDAGAGDVVPLRLIPWNFVSTATYDGTKWTVANDPNNTINASTDFPPFPEWHQVIKP